MELPTGKVVFLTTDIAGSTRHWEEHPEVMTPALIRHNQLAEEVLARHNGFLLSHRGAGDSLFMVFSSPIDALRATVALQIAYEQEPWIGGISLRVRMGLHYGEVHLVDGNYYGQMVNFTIRIASLGHPGQILLSEPMFQALENTELSPITLRNLGTYQQTEGHGLGRVYQASHPDLPVYFPRLRFVHPPPNNIPNRAARFIGRESIIGQVRDAFQTSRLLTITGGAGVGKTRIALEVAKQMVEAEGEGIWYIDFEQRGALGKVIARAVGAHIEENDRHEENILQHISSQNLFLVWDHVERLEGEEIPWIESILSVAPQVRILVCKSTPLGLESEATFELPSLQLPTLNEAPESLTQNEAVALFMDCISATLPYLALTEQHLQNIAVLCQRLQGIPLAIELMGVRFRENNSTDIATENLDSGTQIPLREQDALLAGLVAWSTSLLTASERLLLFRLSVFEGIWTSQLAEKVCADEEIELWEILDLIYTLDSLALLTYEEHDGESYYRMHSTIRAFALEQLKESGQLPHFQSRYITARNEEVFA